MSVENFKWDEGDVKARFDLKECLGEGTYGTVWTAVDKLDGEIVAVKIQSFEDDIDLDYLKLEIELMRRSQSPYTVKFIGCFKPQSKEDEVWIVMEHCLAGSLADLMNITEETFDEDLIQQVAAASLLGLEVLHEAKIIHRDIKAGNILLNLKGNIRITDLGVGADLKDEKEKRNTLIGAPYWMAPEIMLEKGYDVRVDVWSLGITAIELADSVPPNAGVVGEENILKLIPEKDPPTVRLPENFSPEFNDFVAKCVTRPYQNRPSAKQMLNHPFVADAVAQLRKKNGQSRLLADYVKEHKDAILTYRKADPVLFQTMQRADVVSQAASDFFQSRFSRMYSDAMSRPESIRSSVLLPTQQGLHGEKVISKEAQKLLTANDVNFMVQSRELRESIKSGVITPHLAELLKKRRTSAEVDANPDSINAEEFQKEQEKSKDLYNRLLFYYSKHVPDKLRDHEAISRLVEIGMEYGVDVLNEGLVKKYGEPLAELPSKTRARNNAQSVRSQQTQQSAADWDDEEDKRVVSSYNKYDDFPEPITKDYDDDLFDRSTAKRDPVNPFNSNKKGFVPKALKGVVKKSPPPQDYLPTGSQNNNNNTQGQYSHNEKAHTSVRHLADYKDIKKQFEGGNNNNNGGSNNNNNKSNQQKKQVINRNKNVWEINVQNNNNKQYPQPAWMQAQQKAYRQPSNRFLQPFKPRNSGGKRTNNSKGGSSGSTKAKGAKQDNGQWKITPMGYATTTGNGGNKVKKGAKFNDIQSWWEQRQNTSAGGGGKGGNNKGKGARNGYSGSKGGIKRLL